MRRRRPQPPGALAAPVNALERDEDADAVWRTAVNAALAGPYRALFDRIDYQVLLAPPGFEVVLGWRREQEAKLRARLEREGAGAQRAMSDAQLARFVSHYERLTRWSLEEMPGRADLMLKMDADRTLAA